jgi:hypothetical protein
MTRESAQYTVTIDTCDICFSCQSLQVINDASIVAALSVTMTTGQISRYKGGQIGSSLHRLKNRLDRRDFSAIAMTVWRTARSGGWVAFIF